MDLQPLFKRVIGLDVHQAQITACAIVEQPSGEVLIERCQFRSMQRDLRAMAAWCAQRQPDEVVMESTSIYWKSPYAALEAMGIIAKVVNARHVKQVPGRKTDMGDAEWLATLARAGLLRGSFVPPPKLRGLRLVARHHRLHKILNDAGIRLSVVVGDINGQSSRAMIAALLEGQSPHEVSRRLKADRKDLLEALQGELSPQHRFILKALLVHIDALQEQIAQHDAYLLDSLAGEEQDMLALLQSMPGIDRVGAALLLVEIGCDMQVFGRAERLASRAGLCPGNHESAGKRRNGRMRKGNRYVRRLFCEFANSASRTRCALQAKYQALVVRRGRQRSIIALAHKMLRIVYCMLSRSTPYQDTHIDYRALVVQRNAPRWIKALAQFGYLPAAAH
ncbi:transposase IS116/IS110/IS902 [Azotobacter vinelandii CA]|uniref:Transposase IS116/IS110/IS902 n=2 Tax=Azotobacter vinelandii TaxID=354 RepID=C1DQX3_AZOVD|nr:IS110 family transposase [Azotobacter vinelandii]ACO77646.1 transposase IS116/IS110/IS902 [Azotobacter vinelandii DJ]AGK15325.1 transposase IS116/IS110/IS902 [Azotobacter vinelandii CA]AGK19903.1 transposase IS116/IS110/IS902 [Azotobacter vinelandii CA6]SFX82357.1 Transposase [Azotobacter vinelandii]GLK59704.1 IS110 family transposase [Azotobacter vinelandii]